MVFLTKQHAELGSYSQQRIGEFRQERVEIDDLDDGIEWMDYLGV